jgi:hypothetical protein
MRRAFVSDDNATTTRSVTLALTAHQHFYTRAKAVNLIPLLGYDV